MSSRPPPPSVAWVRRKKAKIKVERGASLARATAPGLGAGPQRSAATGEGLRGGPRRSAATVTTLAAVAEPCPQSVRGPRRRPLEVGSDGHDPAGGSILARRFHPRASAEAPEDRARRSGASAQALDRRQRRSGTSAQAPEGRERCSGAAQGTTADAQVHVLSPGRPSRDATRAQRDRAVRRGRWGATARSRPARSRSGRWRSPGATGCRPRSDGSRRW
jgi:hypothetical protein